MKHALSILAIALLALALSGDTLISSSYAAGTDQATAEVPQWEQLCDDAVATIYHAVPAQCNDDVTHTASMKVIDPSAVEQYRIIAMERTMMAQYGIGYGDVVKVEGADSLDGLWTVEDTMNKRYAGKHKIDFLVPKNITSGYWKNVKVYRAVRRRTATAG